MATEEQKAIWRADRALSNGKEPMEADMELLGPEMIQKLRDKAEAKAQVQVVRPRQFQAPVQQPLPPHSPPEAQGIHNQPHATEGQPRSDDAKKSGPQVDKRELGKEGREWYQFFDKHLGPMVVLLIYFATADLDRAAFYAPSPQECHDFAPHGAKLMPKAEDALKKLFGSPVVTGAHAVIMNSSDAIPAVMVVIGYLHRIGALDNLLPWLHDSAGKVVERGRNNGAGTAQEPTEYTGGLRPVDSGQYSTNGTGPIDINSVRGLGSQWSPDI